MWVLCAGYYFKCDVPQSVPTSGSIAAPIQTTASHFQGHVHPRIGHEGIEGE